MSNMAIKNMIRTTRTHFQVPVTPRGRALHTVDWFMNGKPTRQDYDNAEISIKSLRG
jgi:hypothetical protein